MTTSVSIDGKSGLESTLVDLETGKKWDCASIPIISPLSGNSSKVFTSFANNSIYQCAGDHFNRSCYVLNNQNPLEWKFLENILHDNELYNFMVNVPSKGLWFVHGIISEYTYNYTQLLHQSGNSYVMGYRPLSHKSVLIKYLWQCAVQVNSSTTMIIGGYKYKGSKRRQSATKSIWVFDWTTGNLTLTNMKLKKKRYNHLCTSYQSDKVLVHGGSGIYYQDQTTEIIDLKTETVEMLRTRLWTNWPQLTRYGNDVYLTSFEKYVQYPSWRSAYRRRIYLFKGTYWQRIREYGLNPPNRILSMVEVPTKFFHGCIKE